MSAIWILSGACLIAAPAYVVENFNGEILTLEQRPAWLSVPSTIVTYAVTIPLAALGVLLWSSAFIALFSASIASFLLAVVYQWRTRQLGYRLLTSAVPS